MAISMNPIKRAAALFTGLLGMALPDGLGAASQPAQPVTTRGSVVIEGIATRPGRIELPYVLYRKPGPARPTLFFLGGGPGVSNLKNVPPAAWLDDFDVAVLEYRGVGKSSIVLDSPHFGRGLRTLRGRLALADTAPLQAAYRAGFDDLRRQGVAFDDFSIDALAEDLERLRQALDVPQVYLVGHSFGTRIALAYQTRHRDRVAGSVLFAMNTPGGFVWNPEQTQQVLTRYADHLAHRDGEAAAALRETLAQPAARPDRFLGVLPVNDAKALFVAYFMSFNTWTRDSSLRALTGAQRGEAARWFLFSASYDWFIRFGFNWADFFLKAYATDCDEAAIQRVDAEGQGAVFQSPSSVLFAGTGAYTAAGGRCAPTDFTPDYRNTLAINGEFDTTTPIERKPAELPAERYIVIPGAGHADILYPDLGSAARWLRGFLLHPDRAAPPATTAHKAGDCGVAKPPAEPGAGQQWDADNGGACSTSLPPPSPPRGGLAALGGMPHERD
ncbi:alpha/beta hydrolase [Chitiniphilus eburneus]|uniref:Alpha/beta fold hydrolase n=1 Tax=Chitiniphilus eburneus TaxID=2571148 RepID=A0A4U0PTA3_9NEIS|nr:alpha/beta hydrolase [Chitiniphilus eburneus]TJZ70742.1 alpha/beta fold hydrolase [Chitiniphilus eburneus]